MGERCKGDSSKDGRKVKENLQKMGERLRRYFKRWEEGEGESSKVERNVQRRIFNRWEQGKGESSKDGRKVKENLQKMGAR